MKRLASRLAGLAGLLAVLPAGAHHSIQVHYHVDREITVTGTVGRTVLGNPHVRIYLNVETADGEEQWLAEGQPIVKLLRKGWTGTELRPGDEIRVVGYPTKAASKTLYWQRLYLPDGREIWSGDFDAAAFSDLVKRREAPLPP